MVWICTGSFRGVCDQPVTDHDGSISAGVRHTRRVFGAYSARMAQAARARSTFVPHCLDEVLRPRHALLREVQRLSQEGRDARGPGLHVDDARAAGRAAHRVGIDRDGVAAVTERGVVGGGRATKWALISWVPS